MTFIKNVVILFTVIIVYVLEFSFILRKIDNKIIVCAILTSRVGTTKKGE